jgi:hypothetical protein
MSKPKPPANLNDAGKSLWREVVGTYDLRADELAVLHGACAATDRLADLNAAWRDLGRPYMTKGSMGQEVIHPLIGEIRALEAHVATQTGKLKLPDEPGGERPNQQRAAAQSRWAAAHGAG